MKKYLAVGLLGLFIWAFSVTDAFAGAEKFQPPENYVSISLFIFYPSSVGYKHLIGRNIYLTGNLDYVDENSELLFQAGAAYMIPVKILFLRVYGGGGMEASRNHGHMYPYVMAGTTFWILYTEVVHPLQNQATPGFRFGFSFSF